MYEGVESIKKRVKSTNGFTSEVQTTIYQVKSHGISHTKSPCVFYFTINDY